MRMNTIITFVIVLSLIACLVGWFKFADYIGDELNSPTLGFILMLGVPIALVTAVVTSLATQ